MSHDKNIILNFAPSHKLLNLYLFLNKYKNILIKTNKKLFLKIILSNIYSQLHKQIIFLKQHITYYYILLCLTNSTRIE